MDKKSRNKTSNFLKKEGFYVILFVCLCIVATVAAIVARNSKVFNGQPPVAIVDRTAKPANNSVENKPSVPNNVQVPNNATQVKDTPIEQKKTTAPVANKPVPVVQTTAKPILSFVKPVSGTLLLGFQALAQIEPTDSSTIQSIETVNGMYINCKIGQDVFSSESGVVVDSKSAINYGQVLTIKHDNGYKTVYGNLSETQKVKVGDKVVRGQKIAAVGKTSNHYPSYKALNDGFIYFQVLKNDVPVDPTTCSIKY
ncbi:MAG: M23 family metallopeptidase [Clostridiaceae bacterium]|nr:M23 family metallopeptidase [Clostridiaceae bacterium]